MKRWPLAVLVVIAALLPALTATGAEPAYSWSTVANARYGFTVEVPAFFKAGPESTNGDGHRFSYGEATIAVWAGWASGPCVIG